ncbi:MAG: alpha/beta hydrolase [Methanomicrobiales archaeon]
MTCAQLTTREEVLFSNDTYIKTRIVMHTQNGDVVTYLAAPTNPTAAIIYVPRAGEKIIGRDERMVRYAAVASGVDPQFAGYVGFSTSDWGLFDSTIQLGYSGDPVRFSKSVEPSTYFSKIAPRPVWIYHAVYDPIIPFSNGQQFFDIAQEPKTFSEFSGDHGINSDVDTQIIMHLRQIYATQG